MLPQNFFIFILFYDFYRKAYQKKPEATESVSILDLNNNEVVSKGSKMSDKVFEDKNNFTSYESNKLD